MCDSKLLPHREEPRVEESKLLDYLLNARSKDDESKARYFRQHGFRRKAWTILRDALLEHGANREISVSTKTTFGEKFILECEIVTPDGFNPCIRTVWISEGKSAPRLVTAYPR